MPKKVSIAVTSGKEYLKMGILSYSILTMTKDKDENIILGKSANRYEILEYNWDGARYGTKTNADTKGRGMGAIIGNSLGVAGSKGKSQSTTTDIEVSSNATLKFRNIKTGNTFVIGFSCNSKIDIQLQNFGVPSNKATFTNQVLQQKSTVELLKEYKELLDMEIITEEEFMEKKRELLE